MTEVDPRLLEEQKVESASSKSLRASPYLNNDLLYDDDDDDDNVESYISISRFLRK